MNRSVQATRIGLFLLAVVALLVAAVVAVSSGGLFAKTERGVLFFNGSIYGLDVGAPVVFRGVRLGSVASIGLVPDASRGGFAIPVVVELDRAVLGELSLRTLVQQGLRATLATQSLLTGQLYVALDLRPPGLAPAANAVVEIPTSKSPLQSLQTQLESIDFAKLAQDITAIAATTRQLIGSPQVKQTLEDLSRSMASLQRLSGALEQRTGPLASAAQATLADTRRAVAGVGQAAERLGGAADRIGAAAGRADALLAPGAPLLASLQTTSDELARTATARRQAAAEDGALAQNLDRTLNDVARASRAVRDLADLLERQPDALLRGRAATP